MGRRRREGSTGSGALQRPSQLLGMAGPLRSKAFRRLWGADLLVCLAFEMEIVVIGWTVLQMTESVLWLTAFGAVQFSGTLLAPVFGAAGYRFGDRRTLVAMRLCYAFVACCITAAAWMGALTPLVAVFLSAVASMVKPSDLGVRGTLSAALLPAGVLPAALSLGRANMDAARILGALGGAASLQMMGLTGVYVLVSALYLLSAVLVLAISLPLNSRCGPGKQAMWQNLRGGFAEVRATPILLSTLLLSWVVNLSAFPLSHGLLPQVADELYRLDSWGFALLSATFSFGALSGSLTVSLLSRRHSAHTVMMAAALAWSWLLLVFSQTGSWAAGASVLFLIGMVQSWCMVPMSLILLQSTRPEFRGSVMGLRMLSIYGLSLGLMAGGVLIQRYGLRPAIAILGGVGVAATASLLWMSRSR